MLIDRYGLTIPLRIYALFETAIRARSGRTPNEHNRYISKLFSRYSQVLLPTSSFPFFFLFFCLFQVFFSGGIYLL